MRDRITESYVNVLIDRVMISADLSVGASGHRAWRPYQDSDLQPFNTDLNTASDHIPASVTLDP